MSRLPKTYKKLIVQTLSNDFKAATNLITQPLNISKLNPSNVLVKPKYVGINASDINFTSGKYYPGKKPPFPVGFEAVGEIVHTTSEKNKSQYEIGQPVAYCLDGAFSEYHELPASRVFPIKSTHPDYVGLLVSGMTAKLALDDLGDLKKFSEKNKKQNILVSAAAGGTGHIFAQLAKLENPEKNFVVGTTSTGEKAAWLENFGCVDSSINLSQLENSSSAFNKKLEQLAIKNKLDLVYESVGKDLFDNCLTNLNYKGRLITIGYIGGYKDSNPRSSVNVSSFGNSIPVRLLMKSASIKGFFLFHYAPEWREAFNDLCEIYESGQLKIHTDGGFGVDQFKKNTVGVNGETIINHKFEGLESVSDAVDYLYSRKSVGKIVVKF